jgi:hypothetical protein
VDGRLAETTGEPLPHRLAQALAGNVLLSHAADGGGPLGHFHDARGALPERPFPFQVPVGPRHRLRIRQQLLGTGAVLRKPGAGLEGPRGNVGPNLAGDLLMDRHRGIVLNVDHDAVDTTATRRAIQPFVDTITVKENSYVLIPRDLYQRLTDYDDGPWTDGQIPRLMLDCWFRDVPA